MYRDFGIRGFWKGVVPSLIMVANPSIQYMLVEYLRNSYVRLLRRSSPSTAAAMAKGLRRVGPGEMFVLSALAKVGATFCTYPLLVVKSRIQTSRRENAAKVGAACRRPPPGRGTDRTGGAVGAPPPPPLPLAQATIPEQVRSILQREGLGGFYHGMGRCCSAARGPGSGSPPRPPGTDGEAGGAPAGTKMFQSVFAAALLYTIKDELAARTRTAIAGPALRAAPAR